MTTQNTSAERRQRTVAEAETSYEAKSPVAGVPEGNYVEGFVSGRTVSLPIIDTLSSELYGADAKEEFFGDVTKALIAADFLIAPVPAKELYDVFKDNPDLDEEGRDDIATELRDLGVITG